MQCSISWGFAAGEQLRAATAQETCSADQSMRVLKVFLDTNRGYVQSWSSSSRKQQEAGSEAGGAANPDNPLTDDLGVPQLPCQFPVSSPLPSL